MDSRANSKVRPTRRLIRSRCKVGSPACVMLARRMWHWKCRLTALIRLRAHGVTIDCAVFTNLTRDHLDYHETMEAYGATKARLFEWEGLKHAVINCDDLFGRDLLSHSRAQNTWSFGLYEGDIHATRLIVSLNGLRSRWKRLRVRG